jgi:hypothetical protein
MLGNTVTFPDRPRIVSTRLRDEILKRWVREDEIAPPTPENLRIYTSGLRSLCPRAYALACAYGRSVREQVDVGSLWNMAWGSAAHHMFQHEILPSLGDTFQAAWGGCDFKNEVPEHTDLIRGWGPRPLVGEGAPFPVFRESKAWSEKYKLVGKVDGVLVWPGEEPMALELKTAALEYADKINPTMGGQPFAGDVLQCQGYFLLFGFKRALLTYVVKGIGQIQNAIYEYEIERDENVIEMLSSRLLDTVEAVKRAYSARMGDGEERPTVEALRESEGDWLCERLCQKKSETMARRCALRDLCFPKKKKR